MKDARRLAVAYLHTQLRLEPYISPSTSASDVGFVRSTSQKCLKNATGQESGKCKSKVRVKLFCGISETREGKLHRVATETYIVFLFVRQRHFRFRSSPEPVLQTC